MVSSVFHATTKAKAGRHLILKLDSYMVQHVWEFIFWITVISSIISFDMLSLNRIVQFVTYVYIVICWNEFEFDSHIILL